MLWRIFMKLPGRLLLPLIVVFGAACSSSSVPEPIAVAGIEDASLHAIMTQNIERHLNRLDDGRREDVVGVIQSAQGLQLSADVIMTMRSSLGLRPDAATVFVERATQLKGFAGELEQLARAGELAELRGVVDQINGSCAGCHNLFRR
jgi:hypothetical protein